MSIFHSKSILFILAFLLSFPSLIAQTACPNFEWAVKAGGGSIDNCNAIAVDDSGNSYITGSFQDTITFGNTTLISSGYEDVFVAKLDNKGKCQWAVKAGGTSQDIGYAITIDLLGNIYITGYFVGISSFGNITLNSSGLYNLFIAKLDSQGKFLWALRAGGTTNNSSFIHGFYEGNGGYGIAVDVFGNCFITSAYTGTVSFGSYSLTSLGGNDICIAKIDTKGNFKWAIKAGGKGDDFSLGISIDALGNNFITGRFEGAATFGNKTLNTLGYSDIFIAKIDSGGQFKWAFNYGGSNFDLGNSIAVDTIGNIYVTGLFQSSAKFGNTNLISNGDNDIFILKLNNQGQIQWVTQGGGANGEYGKSIKLDKKGNCYVIGDFVGSTNFGNITLTPNQYENIFVVKLDTQGNYLWAIDASGKSLSNINSKGIGLDKLGNAYIIGVLKGIGDFGHNSLTSTLGSQDVFVSAIKEGNLTLNSLNNKTISCGSSTGLNPLANNFSEAKWSPTLGVSNPNILNPDFSPLKTTTYTLTVKNSCGFSIKDSAIITVQPFTTITASAQNKTIDCGTSTQLSTTLKDSFPNITYKWTPVTGLNNPNIANPIASPGLSTVYTVTATRNGTCSISSDINITVNNPNPPTVNITSNTGSFELCNNGLTLSAKGYSSYLWSTGSTASSINVTKTGWYKLIVYEASGCAGVDSVEVKAIAKISAPQGTVLCPNQASQKLTLAASGGMDSYKWNTGEQTQSIQVTTQGTYSVTVTKGSCTFTTSVSVTISNGQASADFSYTAKGLLVDFLVISPSINFLSWQFGDGKTSTDENPTHVYAQAGTYKVIIAVTDLCGNTAEKEKSITVSGQTNSIAQINDNFVIVYPNPANETINFDVSKVLAAKRILIYDINGKSVIEKNIETLKIQLNINQLSKGIYFYKIIGSENVNSGKFLVE